MNKQSLIKEITAVLAAIFFLAIGFIAVWLSKEFLKQQGETLSVALLFVPIIAYMIFSGRLKELKAGGVEAKFVDVAGRSVELSSETIEPSLSDMEIVAKGGVKELQKQIPYLNGSKLIILTLILGKEGYNRSDGSEYLETLSHFRNFKFVVFLDKENKFVAYTPSWAMSRILKMDALGSEFIEIISRGDIQELKRYPGIVTKTISTKATNTEALSEMTAQNLEALVVIDENRKLKGAIERDQIISKLMLALTK